jgi:hypothetical protein
MKAQGTRIFFLALALVVMLVALGPVGPVKEAYALAQPADVRKTLDPDPNIPSVAIIPTMSYQGKLVENGLPVTGSRPMTFRLYDSVTGGTLIWSEGPKTVTVSNGLFTVSLGDTTPFTVSNFALNLYLEIDVAGTVLPRQVLQGAPYALSLAAGAEVRGNTGASLLSAVNDGSGEAIKGYSYSGNGLSGTTLTGHGVFAQGNSDGLYSSALYSTSVSPGGIALWAHNAATNSSDATMVMSNDGTGDLLKGFGGDSGEDEFRFKNDGTFQDKAPSYLFTPGASAYLHSASTGAAIDRTYSMVTVVASTTGQKTLCLPISLPSVLYGQPVKIEQARVYYGSGSSLNYIDETGLFLLDQWGVMYTLVNDTSNYNSTSNTTYDLVPNSFGVLTEDRGSLAVCWQMMFQDTYFGIRIIGVRLKLRHHPLY